MLLLRPLAGVGVLDERPPRARMRLRPVVGRPRGQGKPATSAAHARELGRGALVVGSENRAEGGGDGVELGVAVRQLLAVALVEADREPLLLRGAARLCELVRGDVDAGHPRTGSGGT